MRKAGVSELWICQVYATLVQLDTPEPVVLAEGISFDGHSATLAIQHGEVHYTMTQNMWNGQIYVHQKMATEQATLVDGHKCMTKWVEIYRSGVHATNLNFASSLRTIVNLIREKECQKSSP